MKSKLITILVYLLFGVCYAMGNNYYLLGDGGVGNAFFMEQEGKTILPLSQIGFGGISFQRPYRWNTALTITGLCHGQVTAIPSSCTDIHSIYPLLSIEAAIKKSCLKINMGDSTLLRFYGKGGLWAGGTLIKYCSNPSLILHGSSGPLGGIGFQVISSRVLFDVSINGLVSCLGNMKHAWAFRVGIGWRLWD